ncbi:hypothetical protein [Natrarchaeobaculum aegyptiacum]|uniref:Uncharacterized protein n=1 Tax=Natrarchaeobaculum aegyptiacum TaxID=745377 RepID=A0A2Z2I0B5_9EURY|nr:hypothetical protein [Natrarchaeobaculum aegyptiacum]ARS91827.1 hypothetical protein B1756_12255 [Natrarchaeobaculum aegyptiacum]
MATHGTHGTQPGASLPTALPVELPALTRLSWELGSRIVSDEETIHLEEWERTGSTWALSIFRVTDNTVVLRVRTPVGRQRFYGAAQLDLEEALPRLEAAPDWNRLE